MIHIIQHHIGKGSYAGWYELFKFNEPVKYYAFDNKDIIEGKRLGNPPYIEIFEKQIEEINPQVGDYVFFDAYYILDNCSLILSDKGIFNYIEYIEKISKKHNNCKLVLFDTDNQLEYQDTKRFTVFSNKFVIDESYDSYNLNCNYYKYRLTYQNYLPYLNWFVNFFENNVRQKKMNMIIGADKKFRLEVFRYAYRIGLDKDSWMGYSGFSKAYNDSELSEDLLQWKKEKLPVILDTTMEFSNLGSVNVEMPPLPITSTSYVSAICETQIFVGNMVHISEKTYNPFLSKNIPLILGSSKLNTYLKNHGYWLADDIFDISEKKDYRSIIEQFCRNLDVINNMSFDELYNYYQKNLGKINGNHHRLIKNSFLFEKSNYKRHITCV